MTGSCVFSVDGGGGVCRSVEIVWKNGFTAADGVEGNSVVGVDGTVNDGWGGGCGGR